MAKACQSLQNLVLHLSIGAKRHDPIVRADVLSNPDAYDQSPSRPSSNLITFIMGTLDHCL